MPDEISLQGEIQRKIIHIGSGIIPLLVIFYGKDSILPYLFTFTILFIIIDFLKIKVNWIQNIYKFFFNSLSRNFELIQLTGASYVLTGCTIVLFIFPENIAVFSMLVLCISDTFAALIGRVCGKNKIGYKTLEGTFAFILVGFIISIYFQNIPILFRIIAVIFSGLTELTFSKINDNLSIPLTVSLVCFLGTNI